MRSKKDALPPVNEGPPSITDPDLVRAEASSEDLRGQLRRFFEWHRSQDPEDLVQEVLYRALKRLSEGAQVYAADPRSYFFGIARNLLKEGWKSPRRREEMLDPCEWDRRASSARDAEQVEANLAIGECLERLSQPDSQLIGRASCRERV